MLDTKQSTCKITNIRSKLIYIDLLNNISNEKITLSNGLFEHDKQNKHKQYLIRYSGSSVTLYHYPMSSYHTSKWLWYPYLNVEQSRLIYHNWQKQAQANLILPAFSQGKRGITLTITKLVTLLSTIKAKFLTNTPLGLFFAYI